MPNWCITDFKVFGERGQLTKFYMDMCRASGRLCGLTEKEREYTTKEGTISHVSEDWFGNMLLAAGYSMKEIDEGGFPCRGLIYAVELEDDGETVYIGAECAWNPYYDTMEVLLNEKYKGLSFVMRAEEPGCEIFINTDRTFTKFKDRWRLYWSLADDDGEERYIETEEEMKSELELINRVKTPKSVGDDINEIIKWHRTKFEESGGSEDDRWLYIDEFTDM